MHILLISQIVKPSTLVSSAITAAYREYKARRVVVNDNLIICVIFA